MKKESSSFLVNPYQDPVVVRIQGKASFHNSNPISTFFDRLLEQGRKNFLVDLEACTGMDSTFLGILAGLALQLMRPQKKGSVVLTRLSERNLELVRNLGLHRILVIDEGKSISSDISYEGLSDNSKTKTESQNAQMVLRAHESLVEADASNEAKFQDVISFLKNQIDDH